MKKPAATVSAVPARRRPAAAVVEGVEPRRLLVGVGGSDGLNGADFALNVNFQASGRAPSGYVADLGLPLTTDQFGDFGWNRDNAAEARTRDSARSFRYDSFTHLQKPSNPDARWEVVVPDGLYRVFVSAGDPAFQDSFYHLTVENFTAARGQPTPERPFVEGLIETYVRDGKLTITSGVDAVNNKVNFAQIERIGGLPEAGAPIRVNFGPPGGERVDGYLADTGAAFGAKASGVRYGWERENPYFVDRQLFADQRFDSVIFMEGDGTPNSWEIEVPAGRYEVFAVAGDARLSNSVFNIDAEGVDMIFGTPGREGGARWVPGYATADVTDGRLTLTVGDGGVGGNNKLNYVELRRVATIPNGLGSGVSEDRAFFTQVSDTPVRRYETQVVELDGEILTFGGFVDGQRYEATTYSSSYDPITDTHTRIADLPTRLTHAAPIVVDGEVWLIGGFVGDLKGPPTADTWIYNRQDNTYRRGPDLPVPNGAGQAVIVGRFLHYMGGMARDFLGRETTGNLASHLFIDITDPGRRGWVENPDMPIENSHFGLAAVGNGIYMLGGMSGYNEWSENRSDMWRYGTDTGRWTRLRDLPLKVSHINESTFVDGNKIVFVGGAIEVREPTNNAGREVWSFDVTTGAFSRLPDLPAGRKNPASRLVDGRLSVLGGGTVFGPTGTTYQINLGGTFEAAPSLPVALGETTGVAIGRHLYVVGDGNDQTLRYDTETRRWATVAPRPVPGKDQLAHLADGKMYLFGGVSYRTGRQVIQDSVQVYDPATDSWSLATPMPYGSLASQSALIDGWIYFAGGVTEGNTTTNRVVRYQPSTDTWDRLPRMPVARDSGAAGTDGRSLFIFGGRDNGDRPGNGYDDTLVYTPRTGQWRTSDADGLARLPQRRAGISRAPLVDGKFYIVGGETGDDRSATGPDGVYARIDVYDPATDTFTRGPDLPTGRHGIGPLFTGGRLYVFGGGTQQGESRSDLMDVLNLFG